MTTFVRAFVLGLVVATFALIIAVLTATITLDVLHVDTLGLELGPIDLYTFASGPQGFTANVGAGAPALVVALATLNALAAARLTRTANP